jgi:rsbT co-antagonist protein RsbR
MDTSYTVVLLRQRYVSRPIWIILSETSKERVCMGFHITTNDLLNLAQSYELLQHSLDAIGEPFAVKDRQHRWVAGNTALAKVIGRPLAEIIGRSDPDFFPVEQAKIFWEGDDTLFASGEPIFQEEEITTGDGVVRTIYTRKYPLHNNAGEIIGLCALLTDITEIAHRRQEVEHLEQDIAAQMQTIREQQHLLEQISVPVIQIWDQVLLLPLIGIIDEPRANRIMESTLEAIAAASATVLIVDITGVPVVDTNIASYLVQSIQAAQLLGCESLLVGISPQIAQTLVALGVDFSHITTRATLQQGLAHALEQLNFRVQQVT